jgi:hypothetical protein
VLVACRILQGCGGAMMVPVGRLTMVRTFAKSELIRAMSFVAIPGLIGPMLGPIAGGLIVGYFHWRVIFFVNIPIGLHRLVSGLSASAGLSRENSNPLDVAGLILFGSGIALLSYVLEVFGEHTLSVREILGLLAISIAALAGYGLHADEAEFPIAALSLFRIRTFRAAVSGSFFTRLGIGGIPFSCRCSIRWPRFHSDSIRPAHDAAGDCRHEPEADDAAHPDPLRLPRRADFQHRDPRPAHSALFATIGVGTPVWLSSWLQAFCFGSSARCNTRA